MRTESKYGITGSARLPNSSFPVNALGSDIHDHQRGLFISARRQSLLESGQRAHGLYFHVVMAQRIAHLHGEEKVFFQRENMRCHTCPILIFRRLVNRPAEEVT